MHIRLQLAVVGEHRCDLAGTAKLDTDFELIDEVTGQPVQRLIA